MEKAKVQLSGRAVLQGVAVTALCYLLLLLLAALFLAKGLLPQDWMRIFLCVDWLLSALAGAASLGRQQRGILSGLCVGLGSFLLSWALGLIFLENSSFANGGVFFLSAALLGGLLGGGIRRKGGSRSKKRSRKRR